MENGPNINIPALQESIEKNRNLIRLNPQRIIYSVDELEITLMEKHGQSHWKDVFFICLGVGLPTFGNLCIDLSNKTEEGITMEILINTVLISVSVIVGILSFYTWNKDKNEFKNTIKMIKEKPLHFLPDKQGKKE